MTSRIIFGDFDAEKCWQPPDLAMLPKGPAQDSVNGMQSLLLSLARPGDIVAVSDSLWTGLPPIWQGLGFARDISVLQRPASGAHLRPFLETYCSEHEPIPYAVTAQVERSLDGSKWGLPPAAVGALVNSKTWSHQLRKNWGLDTASAHARSPRELAATGSQLLRSSAIVVKEPYGVSGRGSMRVSSLARLERLVRHFQAEEQAGRRVELVVEPYLDKLFDFSCLAEVEPGGATRIVTFQRNANAGLSFRAVLALSEPSASLCVSQEHLDTMLSIGAELFGAGYVGPYCVDSMLLKDGSVCAITEINARFSMGRLCHELTKSLSMLGPATCLTYVPVLTREHDLSDCANRLVAAFRDLDRWCVPLALTGGVLNGSTVHTGRLFVALSRCDLEHPERDLELVSELARHCQLSEAGRETCSAF